VRFNDQTKGDSLIKLMTDGVLLAEIQRDRFLDAYDCIILDEAHERSLNIDLLMAYLQRLLPRRPDLRLIITSATIDAEQYANHFQDALGAAPVVNVEGRGFPVEVRYRGAMSVREAMLDERRESNSLLGSNRGSAVASIAEEDFDSVVQRFCNAVDELLSEGRGDILCFFATEREIRETTIAP
jgi:ATP-dependent helicase HrpA